MAVARHINFFELQKACAEPGCPLCRIVDNRTRRYIDNMLFEHVSDRSFRAVYRASGGFCDIHAKNLESFRDGLAVAILGRDILEDRITSFKRRQPWNKRGQCPVCAERDHIEEEYLSFLAEITGDSGDERELREAVTSGSGLCIPHYGMLLETAKGRPRKVPQWLIEFHEGKFEALLRRAGQFIELSAYGRQEEFAKLPLEDQIVWKELAISLRGGAENS
ncbi:hypothetical protein AGMMS49960_12410 [Betaproteobacteria bacterium]|nr:hypothetical protein AGMMS49960_12410 [Betaproteobacteria bacterium]